MQDVIQVLLWSKSCCQAETGKWKWGVERPGSCFGPGLVLRHCVTRGRRKWEREVEKACYFPKTFLSTAAQRSFRQFFALLAQNASAAPPYPLSIGIRPGVLLLSDLQKLLRDVFRRCVDMDVGKRRSEDHARWYCARSTTGPAAPCRCWLAGSGRRERLRAL